MLPQPSGLIADIPEQQDLAAVPSLLPTRYPGVYNIFIWGVSSTYRLLVGLGYVPVLSPPSPRIQLTTPNLLYRLHSTFRPGLPEREFHRLLMRCECGIVSTRRRHTFHVCLTTFTVVISTDVSLLGEGEFLRLLYKLDTGVTLDEFAQMFARCTCGLVTTKRRFPIHECLAIV